MVLTSKALLVVPSEYLIQCCLITRGKFLNLEDLSYKVKPGCTDHAPWPHGICTKCQPNAVTLARQNYRHVDNIMFEDGQIVDRFIDAWRKSGRQVALVQTCVS